MAARAVAGKGFLPLAHSLPTDLSTDFVGKRGAMERGRLKTPKLRFQTASAPVQTACFFTKIFASTSPMRKPAAAGSIQPKPCG